MYVLYNYSIDIKWYIKYNLYIQNNPHSEGWPSPQYTRLRYCCYAATSDVTGDTIQHMRFFNNPQIYKVTHCIPIQALGKGSMHKLYKLLSVFVQWRQNSLSLKAFKRHIFLQTIEICFLD